MASLFDISAKIRLNTNDFSTQLQRAEKKVVGFAKKSEREFKKIGKTFKNLGKDLLFISAGSTAALAVIVNNFRKSTDEIGKWKKELGVSTEALSQYVYVTELSGLAMTDWIESIRRQQDTLVSGRGDDVLAKLGLDPESLTQLSADQAFEQIIDAIGQVGNAAERTSYAIDIWGKSGARMLRLSEDGAEGIAQLRKEADEYGLTITEYVAKQQQDFSDNLARLGYALLGVSRIIATNLTPIIEKLAIKTTAVVKSVVGWIKENPNLFKWIVLIGAAATALTTILGIGALIIGQVAFAIASLSAVAATTTPIVTALSGANTAAAASSTAAATGTTAFALAITGLKVSLGVVGKLLAAITVVLVVVFAAVKYGGKLIKSVASNAADWIATLKLTIIGSFNTVYDVLSNGTDRLFTWITQGLLSVKLAIGEVALFAAESLNFGGLLNDQVKNLRNFTNEVREDRSQLESAYEVRVQERAANSEARLQRAADASYATDEEQTQPDLRQNELVDNTSQQLAEIKKTNQILQDLLRQQNGIGLNKVPVGAY